MGSEDATPSESEWLIMEVLWESDTPMTSSAVIRRLEGKLDMTPKMIRVLMNRLCQKGILSHRVDEKDSRVYHYSVLKSKEECLRSKSRTFFRESEQRACVTDPKYRADRRTDP